jgi:hypothetical protein
VSIVSARPKVAVVDVSVAHLRDERVLVRMTADVVTIPPELTQAQCRLVWLSKYVP